MFRKATKADKPENVQSLEQLQEYIVFLADDLKNNSQAWERNSLEDYLRSISRWITDTAKSDGKAKKLTCEEVANLFFVGKIYE